MFLGEEVPAMASQAVASQAVASLGKTTHSYNNFLWGSRYCLAGRPLFSPPGAFTESFLKNPGVQNLVDLSCGFTVIKKTVILWLLLFSSVPIHFQRGCLHPEVQHLLLVHQGLWSCWGVFVLYFYTSKGWPSP